MNQYVLWFDIPVPHIPLMQEIQPLNQRLKETHRLLLREILPAFRWLMMKELAGDIPVAAVFHNYVEVVTGAEDVVQGDDVGVGELAL